MDTHTDADRPPILVVDDDAIIRDLLADLLADAGYRPLVTSDGAAAFGLATSEAVECILLDVVMPLFDAGSFCRAYRDAGGRAPIVFVTVAAPDVVTGAIGARRPDGVIQKPFGLGDLLETLARVVRR